ncbi:hypothetical protein C6988_07630 [Nitrosopumilus sp. b1]|uniref:lamin tail domain-containing protein n=1 Tax=Nitrosopumilus sp. b1 TaxID=2109907 RepID=UPI0015F3C68D|nr:lamin tail domain-containing protein [Nitrosopumilus sp. b1]KAF6242540.1 hypothetical protein C6988_07630 [Nitrosopumilus sp. b1]
MKNHVYFVMFAFLLLGGSIYPAMAQTSNVAKNVVINEIDINPPGNDALSPSEWVELYNPTDSVVDLSGWKIASTTVLKKTLTIPDGTKLNPGQFRTFSYTTGWFTDTSEKVQLRSAAGAVIDETPVITDLSNDFRSWQRNYDAYGGNSISDWKFSTSNAGSSNGKLETKTESSSVGLTLSIDKSQYLFGETATISGSVSEKVFVEKPSFKPAEIKITVKGPSYNKEFTLYPDYFLNYKTTLSLQKVVGINAGEYQVTVTYSDATATGTFSVGDSVTQEKEVQSDELSITTDKLSYIPGERVLITGSTSKVLQYVGMKFKVYDPNGKQVFDGSLYPTNSKFSTSIFMTTVNPVYGEYKISAEYGLQKIETSFQLSEDQKNDELITVTTDKEFYGLGETVTISGRLNKVFVPALDLEIVQSTNLAVNIKGQTSGGNTFKILDVLRPAGDGTFEYKFKLSTDSSRLGSYKVKVSKDIGTVLLSFAVVENPNDYEASSLPLSLSTDKKSYEVGDTIKITGKVNDKKERSSFETPTVKVELLNSKGKPVTFAAGTSKESTTKSLTVANVYAGIPDTSGNFMIQIPVSRSVFVGGETYQLKATYDDRLTNTALISITDSFTVGSTSISATLDKQIYGLGETVSLTGQLGTTIQGDAIKIQLFKPSGDRNEYGATANGGKFTWSWSIPVADTKATGLGNTRVTTSSVFGTYQVLLSTSSQSSSVYFKVSPDPTNDSLSLLPLEIFTDKPVYAAGETLTVLGTAQKRTQGSEGLVVQDRAKIEVLSSTFPYKTIFDAFVYLDAGGNFKSSFVLPVTIFTEGTYKVVSHYQKYKAETVFSVDNDYNLEGSDDKLSLISSTDKSEYSLGDTVYFTGRPNKFIHLEKVDVNVVHESKSQITCGSFVCGTPGQAITIRPGSSGSFTFEYKIPTSPSAIGKYEIIADVEFGKFSTSFTVTDKKPEPTVTQTDKTPTKSIEKFNRITEELISIPLVSTTENNVTIYPKIIQGSLFTPTRGQEANVNMKISTESGVCVIGPGCLVEESTRGPGEIYKVVEVEGFNYKIRYSGSDVRLEKFDILPESSDELLPEITWIVEILKDSQPSQFYYKIIRDVSE